MTHFNGYFDEDSELFSSNYSSICVNLLGSQWLVWTYHLCCRIFLSEPSERLPYQCILEPIRAIFKHRCNVIPRGTRGPINRAPIMLRGGSLSEQPTTRRICWGGIRTQVEICRTHFYSRTKDNSQGFRIEFFYQLPREVCASRYNRGSPLNPPVPYCAAMFTRVSEVALTRPPWCREALTPRTALRLMWQQFQPGPGCNAGIM